MALDPRSQGRSSKVVITESPFTADYRKMQEKIPGSRLEIVPGAGHALFVDQAERFNKLLEDFLGSLDQRVREGRSR